ncbi:MAG: drug/metabolite exporter YedA [Sulfuricellaceae bacterium]|jgi:drug/metabolite transporter (DMT)-like permease
MTIHTPRERWLIGLALLALYLIWGSTYLAMRFAIESFPPFLMAGLRFLVAGSGLYIYLRWRGTPAPTGRQWAACGAVGTLLLLGGNGAVAYAEQTVASGIAALVVATVPLWTLLFAALWKKYPTRREVVGVVIGFAGIVVLNLDGNLRASPAGAVILLLASASWAFGSVWSWRLPLPGGMMTSAAQMLGGGFALMAVSFAFGERLEAVPSLKAAAALAYLVVFGSFVAFSAYLYLLHSVRPAVATSYAYVNPPIAVLLGVWLAGEHLSAQEMVGMGVILAGVVLVMVKRR